MTLVLISQLWTLNIYLMFLKHLALKKLRFMGYLIKVIASIIKAIIKAVFSYNIQLLCNGNRYLNLLYKKLF